MRSVALALTAVVALTGQPVMAFQEAAPIRSLQSAADTKGWEAVGRLNFGSQAYCTGALIAEDLVLTAAHCLFDNASGARFEPHEIEFLAGWRNGRAAAYRGVSRVIAHPDFTYSNVDRVSRVAHDLALLQLDQPIRHASIQPYAIDNRPNKGSRVGIVSYARERSEAASLQESCLVMARQGGVLVLSCEVDHGASGSPIFMLEEGKPPRIVSIVSAMAKVRDKDVALGTALTQPLTVLQDLMAQSPDDEAGVSEPELVTRNLPVVRSLPSLGTEATGGAKFLRPSQ